MQKKLIAHAAHVEISPLAIYFQEGSIRNIRDLVALSQKEVDPQIRQEITRILDSVKTRFESHLETLDKQPIPQSKDIRSLTSVLSVLDFTEEQLIKVATTLRKVVQSLNSLVDECTQDTLVVLEGLQVALEKMKAGNFSCFNQQKKETARTLGWIEKKGNDAMQYKTSLVLGADKDRTPRGLIDQTVADIRHNTTNLDAGLKLLVEIFQNKKKYGKENGPRERVIDAFLMLIHDDTLPRSVREKAERELGKLISTYMQKSRSEGKSILMSKGLTTPGAIAATKPGFTLETEERSDLFSGINEWQTPLVVRGERDSNHLPRTTFMDTYKREATLSAIFDKPQRVQVIEKKDAPKGELASVLMHDWEMGDLWPQFQWVFVIKESPSNPKASLAEVIVDQNKMSCERSKAIQLVSLLLSDPNCQKRILIIVDGHNQWADKAILKNQALSNVLLTTASNKTLPEMNSVISDKGISDEEVESFLYDEFADKAIPAIKQLKANAQLWELAHDPFYLELIVQVIKSEKPFQTITQFFQRLEEMPGAREAIEKTPYFKAYQEGKRIANAFDSAKKIPQEISDWVRQNRYLPQGEMALRFAWGLTTKEGAQRLLQTIEQDSSWDESHNLYVKIVALNEAAEKIPKTVLDDVVRVAFDRMTLEHFKKNGIAATLVLSSLSIEQISANIDNAVTLATYGQGTPNLFLALTKRIHDVEEVSRELILTFLKIKQWSDDCIPVFLEILKRENSSSQCSAAWEMSKASRVTPAVIQALRDTLTSTDEALRSVSVQSLIQLGQGTRDVVQLLMAWVRQQDVQSSSHPGYVERFSKKGSLTTDGIQTLSTYLKSDSQFEIQIARQTLVRILHDSPQVIDTLTDLLPQDRDALMQEVAIYKPKKEATTVPYIEPVHRPSKSGAIRAAQDPNTKLRLQAAESFGSMKAQAQEIMPYLLNLMKDPVESVCIAAIKSAGKVYEDDSANSAEVVSVLLLLAKNKNGLGAAARDSLVQMGVPTEAIQSLLPLLPYDSMMRENKDRLIKIAQKYPKEVMLALLNSLKTADPYTSDRIAYFLREVGVWSLETVPLVFEILKKYQSNVMESIVGYVPKMTPDTVELLLDELSKEAVFAGFYDKTCEGTTVQCLQTIWAKKTSEILLKAILKKAKTEHLPIWFHNNQFHIASDPDVSSFSCPGYSEAQLRVLYEESKK